MKLFSTILLVGALGAPFAAVAETHTRTVSLADVDFSQKAEVAQVHKQLKRAAANVCNYISDRRSVHRDSTSARCYREALASALAQIENPELKKRLLASNG